MNGIDYGSGWCNGDCSWNVATSACEVPPAKDCGGGVFADGKAHISIVVVLYRVLSPDANLFTS